MKLRRLTALLLTLLIIAFSVGCSKNDDTASEKPQASFDEVSKESEAEPEKAEGSSPLLYKVTDSSDNTIWLFGSIHIGRDDFYPLPQSVTEAFESSDVLAVEFDIIAFEKDFLAQTNSLKTFVYTDGTKISDYIDKELYEKAVKILKENKSYNSAFDYYMPSLWSNLIDNALLTQLEFDFDKGIDRYFIKLAKKAKKEIVDIESADLQYSMLSNFSMELQAFLLESSIEAYNDPKAAKKELTDLMDLWASGDEKAFAENLQSEEFDDSAEEEFAEEYNNAVVVNRNKAMTEYAQNALKSGKETFICVGAAHIVGEGAIADNLSKLGYKVQIVR